MVERMSRFLIVIRNEAERAKPEMAQIAKVSHRCQSIPAAQRHRLLIGVRRLAASSSRDGRAGLVLRNAVALAERCGRERQP